MRDPLRGGKEAALSIMVATSAAETFRTELRGRLRHRIRRGDWRKRRGLVSILWASPLEVEGLLRNQGRGAGQMAERRPRRRFTAEFKAQALKRVVDGRTPLGRLPLNLG